MSHQVYLELFFADKLDIILKGLTFLDKKGTLKLAVYFDKLSTVKSELGERIQLCC